MKRVLINVEVCNARLVRTIGLAAVLVGLPPTVSAQAVLTGTIREDSTARPIPGAEIVIEGESESTRSGSDGRYALAGLTTGLRVLRVRRVGFKPLSAAIRLQGGANELDLSLERAAIALDSVVVAAKSPRLGEFEDNRRFGLGHFATAAELEAQHVTALAQLFDGFAPANVRRAKGSAAWVASSRGPRRGRVPELDSFDKHMGAKPDCYANVYVDNVEVYHGRDGERLFDVNSIPVSRIHGVEYYSGPAETPARYTSLNSNCGVIVIWTRRDPQ